MLPERDSICTNFIDEIILDVDFVCELKIRNNQTIKWGLYDVVLGEL